MAEGSTDLQRGSRWPRRHAPPPPPPPPPQRPPPLAGPAPSERRFPAGTTKHRSGTPRMAHSPRWPVPHPRSRRCPTTPLRMAATQSTGAGRPQPRPRKSRAWGPTAVGSEAGWRLRRRLLRDQRRWTVRWTVQQRSWRIQWPWWRKKVVKPPCHAVDNVVAREKLNIRCGRGNFGVSQCCHVCLVIGLIIDAVQLLIARRRCRRAQRHSGRR